MRHSPAPGHDRSRERSGLYCECLIPVQPAHLHKRLQAIGTLRRPDDVASLAICSDQGSPS
jgi:hypothetical protein